ncbi:unnamed protein product [Diabrotica balteata]|uniref:Peptidase S1 domain-containing protein n=1 Tax=Diabrotica balteata TaxID=107213 RepID=A0A9N9SXV3_DIABA|nr:unnamed protein product [Diabrotica balteata]
MVKRKLFEKSSRLSKILHLASCINQNERENIVLSDDTIRPLEPLAEKNFNSEDQTLQHHAETSTSFIMSRNDGPNDTDQISLCASTSRRTFPLEIPPEIVSNSNKKQPNDEVPQLPTTSSMIASTIGLEDYIELSATSSSTPFSTSDVFSDDSDSDPDFELLSLSSKSSSSTDSEEEEVEENEQQNIAPSVVEWTSINEANTSQCGYDSEPLVCCGSDSDFSAISNPSTKPPKPMGRRNPTTFSRTSAIVDRSRSSAILDRKNCGFQESDKNQKLIGFIHGGQETEIDEFPWMALLGYRKGITTRWYCGGSLISHRYVLTAAHCVTDSAQMSIGKLTYIKLGAHHKTREDRHCDKANNCNNGPVITGIDSIVKHERFDPNAKAVYNDIAVIRLAEVITYTAFIRPICLPEPNEGSIESEELTVAGWGTTEHGEAAVKLMVEIPFVTRDECVAGYKRANIVLPELSESQICVGGIGGKDSCKGDSGGPLMKRSLANPLQWYQEGIVSFGSAYCGTPGVPGVYTKVSSFLSWLQSKVKE